MKVHQILEQPRKIRLRALPPLEQIDRQIRRIVDRWPDVVRTPHDRDRERLARDMLRRIEAWDWTGTSSMRITSAAIAVFDDLRCENPEFARVRNFYLAEIAATESTSFLDSMVHVYVETFREGASHTFALAAALSRKLSSLGARVRSLLIALPGLFSPSYAAEALAERMMQGEDPYVDLVRLGLRAPHASGLCLAAHEIFVRRITPQLKRADAREKLLRWVIPASGAPLQSGGVVAVEALLSAWRNETAPDDVRQDLSERIIRAYRDPRLHRGGIWAGFNPDLKAILLNWLTKQDLTFFCDVVTATQNSPHWPPRRDFWLSLYRQGRIDEAWVAFGSAARRHAIKQMAGSSEDSLVRRFGEQVDRGGTTSLLILRIGNKIVVDGCHSYKTHIFTISDRNAPKLYEPKYYCDTIMNRSTRSKSHISIPAWTQWVEQNV